MMRSLPVWLVALMACCMSAPASAFPVQYSETQPCTANVCSRSTTPATNAEGISLIGIRGYRVAVCAATGQTLSGTGGVLIYVCDGTTRLCMHNPGLDQSVTVSGERCQAFPDFVMSAPTNSPDTVVADASSVGVSGGSQVTVSITPLFER